MQTEGLIAISEFCTSHKLEISFIHSLREYGLIETTTIEHTTYIYDHDLSKLEKMTRLHSLDINIEGIETINHLLQEIEAMQTQIIQLKNRLSLHE